MSAIPPATWTPVVPFAGTFQLIQQVSLTTAAVTIDFSAIPQTFNNLKLIFLGKSAGSVAGGLDTLDVRCNLDAGSNYLWSRFMAQASAMVVQSASGADVAAKLSLIPAAASPGTEPGLVIMDFPQYAAGSSFIKAIHSYWNGYDSIEVVNGGGGARWNSATPINAIRLLLDSGANIVAGSIAALYGY